MGGRGFSVERVGYSQSQCQSPVLPALERLGQLDHEFKARMSCLVKSRFSFATIQVVGRLVAEKAGHVLPVPFGGREKVV